MTTANTPRFGFMTANFLGREKGYSETWPVDLGRVSKITGDFFCLKPPTEKGSTHCLAEIAAMGFEAIDLWMAHCHPAWAGPKHIEGLVAAACRKLGII